MTVCRRSRTFDWIVTACIAAVCLAGFAVSACAQSSSIVAVVNGDVISQGDVDSRVRLFALSTGTAFAGPGAEHLRAQVARQLVDEKLRLQEIQRRHIIISDQQIAAAIREIEQRNNMPADALRHKLGAEGVAFSALVDQIRVQIGWVQVVRQQLAERVNVSQAEIAEQQANLEQDTGKPEYRISEIFVPVEDQSNTADAQRFAETVIAELRRGAPFSVAAAQFSESQTALEGGDLGWLQPNELDPAVARIVTQMPVGAVSNPVRVPGGFSIVMLRGKREIGHDLATILHMRQVFLPFSSALDPQAPTSQQRETLEQAKSVGASVHSCDAMEQVAKQTNSKRPVDPGDVRLESVNPPQFRGLLANLPEGKASQPLVSNDGIIVLIVCSREQKNLAAESADDIERRLVAERAELAARQLQRDLERRAQIDMHGDITLSRS